MNRRLFSLLFALALVSLAIFLLSRTPEDTDATGEPRSHQQEKNLTAERVRSSSSSKAPSHPSLASQDIDAPLTETEENLLGDILANESIPNIQASASFLSLAVDPAKSASLRFQALEHALNLLPQDQAKNGLTPFIEEETTPPEMVESILDYAMNTDVDSIALDLGIGILESPHETLHEDAHEMVAFILDVDSDVDNTTLLVEAKKELVKMQTEPEEEEAPDPEPEPEK